MGACGTGKFAVVWLLVKDGGSRLAAVLGRAVDVVQSHHCQLYNLGFCPCSQIELGLARRLLQEGGRGSGRRYQ